MDSSLIPFFESRGVAIMGASTSPEELDYNSAHRIAPSRGMVKSLLRLFDELVNSTRRGIEGCER